MTADQWIGLALAAFAVWLLVPSVLVSALLWLARRRVGGAW